jgi:mono/diheme cytochrome c family protein
MLSMNPQSGSRAAAAIAVLVLFAALAGCGGGSGHGHREGGGGSGTMDGSGMMNGSQGTMPEGGPTGQGPTTTTTPNGGAPANGKALFLATRCGSCHALADAGSTGTAGPDLDRAKPSYQRVVQEVTHGGGGMPAFADSLTGSQIGAIARYVRDATR